MLQRSFRFVPQIWRGSCSKLFTTEAKTPLLQDDYYSRVIDDLNSKFALPYFDLKEFADNPEEAIKNIQYQSPLYRMHKEDSIGLPYFDLKHITTNHKEIQENVNMRKSGKVNVKEDIVNIYKRTVDIEKQQKKLKEEITRLYHQDKGSEEGVKLKGVKMFLSLIQHKLKANLFDNLMLLPNSSHPKAVKLENKDGNIIDVIGAKKDFDCHTPLDHVTIGTKLGIFREQRLHEFTGSRNYFLVGQGAELEQALVNYTLDKLKAKGFMCITVPNIIRAAAFDGSGLQYQHIDKMIYSIDKSEDSVGVDFRLAGTSEVGLCTYFANHAIHEKYLPKKVCCVSTCYRKETDSRNDPRGLFRVHQFTKVEMFAVSTEQQSEEILMSFVNIQKEILQDLNLHAHILEMPCYELGLPAQRKIDIEAWFPGRGSFGEVTSTSNCTDYQAKRLQILHSTSKHVYKYAHTINGTACAVTRLIMALLENGQQTNRTVQLPSCLHPYMANRDGLIRKERFQMQYIGVKQSKVNQKRPE